MIGGDKMIIKPITKNRTKELLKEYRNLQSVRSKALTREINIVYDFELKKYYIIVSIEDKIRLKNGDITYNSETRKYYVDGRELKELKVVASDEEIYGILNRSGTIANAEKILYEEINYTVQYMIKR